MGGRLGRKVNFKILYSIFFIKKIKSENKFRFYKKWKIKKRKEYNIKSEINCDH